MNKRNLFSDLRRTYSKLLVEALREIRRITESYGIAYLAHLHIQTDKILYLANYTVLLVTPKAFISAVDII